MLERDIVSGFIKRMRRDYGKDVWFYKSNDSCTVGLPDIIGVANGVFFAIEMKRKGNRPTQLQKQVIKKIREAGGIAEVAYSVDEAEGFIQTAIERGYQL